MLAENSTDDKPMIEAEEDHSESRAQHHRAEKHLHVLNYEDPAGFIKATRLHEEGIGWHVRVSLSSDSITTS